MNVTYYGHSCFSIQSGGKNLLFDPFITQNELASAIDLSSISADLILISHGHFDHIDDAVALATRTGAQVVANFEICQWLGEKGIENAQPLNLGGGFESPVGRIQYVNAVHSSVLPDGTYGGNPGGFLLSLEEGGLYYAGDTALTLDMQLLAGKCSRAVLPIGDVFTMGVEDAIRAAGLVGVKDVLGVHYDTFPPIKIDHEGAISAFHKAGMTLHLPAIGNSFDF